MQTTDRSDPPGRPARSPSGNRVNDTGRQHAHLRERAHRLVRGEGLPFALAMKVAQGTLRLEQAISRIEEPEVEILPEDPALESRRGAPGRWTFHIVSTTIFVCIAILGWSAWSQYEDQRQRALAGFKVRQALAATIVRTDGSGVVTQISGPSPGTVLTAFCASAVDGYEPVALVPTRQPEVWLGFIQRERDPENRSVVRIERKHGESYWAVGDGKGPIVPERAPDLLEGTPRMPLTSGR